MIETYCVVQSNVMYNASLHMYCKVQRGLRAQIERGSLCVTEVRRAPAGRELEPPAAAAVAQSRGKGSRPLEVRLSCDQIEVKGAERYILSRRAEEELRGVAVSPR